MTTVEKRKALLINAAYFALIIALAYFILKYALGFFFPFFLAFIIAMIIQRPSNFIVERTPLKKGLVCAVFVLLIVSALLFIVSMVGVKIVGEFKGLMDSLKSYEDKIPDIIRGIETKVTGWLSFLPDSAEQSVHDFFEKFIAESVESGAEVIVATATDTANTTVRSSGFNLSWLASPLSGVWSTAKQLPSILITVVISIFSCCFMAVDYDRIVNFIKRQLSAERRRNLSETKAVIMSTMKSMLKAYCLIIFVTFTEMLLGLNVLRLLGVYSSGYIVAISLIVALVDIFPILGTGTILFPWALFSLVTGNAGLAIGLVVIYATISILRQLIEPKLVAQNLGLPPVVTIIGMYIGLRLYGVLGMFVMPFTIMIVKYLNDTGVINLWKKAKPRAHAEKNNDKAEKGDKQDGHNIQSKVD